MKLLLRRITDTLAALVPPAAVRYWLKSFANHPELAERAGYNVVPRVFWSPIPNIHEINRTLLAEQRTLPGINLQVSNALVLLDQLTRFASEIAQIPIHRSSECICWLDNGTYAGFDAATLYAMLRHLQPSRYIEVGCGYSTRASTLALLRNVADGQNCESHFIEPYPSDQFLELKLPGTYHRQRIEQVPLELFGQLEAGDVLFIDTSHVLKTQNDVEHELLRILPSLKPGVWVHVHDIFTPYDYPEEWVLGSPRAGNNEQYALECLLSGGGAWQPRLPLHLLWRDHRATLDRLRPGAPDRPAAFWMQRVGSIQ